MSTITAGTTSGTALQQAGDTTGTLVFKTNDSGSGGTTALTLGTDQSATFAGSATATRLTLSGSTVPTNGVYLPAANTLGFATNSTQVATIDSSGVLSFNSGYGSVAAAYACRAWVNFNGTGTVAIRASGNVTSITDNGTGDYTVNMTTAMPDANYAANINFSVQFGGGYVAGASYTLANTASTNTTPTTSAFRFSLVNTAGSVYDPVYVVASVFR